MPSALRTFFVQFAKWGGWGGWANGSPTGASNAARISISISGKLNLTKVKPQNYKTQKEICAAVIQLKISSIATLLDISK